jgi:hypothetical protein
MYTRQLVWRLRWQHEFPLLSRPIDCLGYQTGDRARSDAEVVNQEVAPSEENLDTLARRISSRLAQRVGGENRSKRRNRRRVLAGFALLLLLATAGCAWHWRDLLSSRIGFRTMATPVSENSENDGG